MAPGRTRWLGCLALCAAGAHASGLTVKVTDPNGAPVAFAVIQLDPVRTDRAVVRAAPAPAIVDQQDKQFRPWVMAVTKGAAVSFANHDDITHHVYSFSPARRFALRIPAGGRDGPLQFDSAGVVVLGCNIHDWMVGYVFVSDSARTAVTAADGSARFSDLVPGAWRVRLWHPGLDEAAERQATHEVEVGDGMGELAIGLGAAPRIRGPSQPLDSGYGR